MFNLTEKEKRSLRTVLQPVFDLSGREYQLSRAITDEETANINCNYLEGASDARREVASLIARVFEL